MQLNIFKVLYGTQNLLVFMIKPRTCIITGKKINFKIFWMPLNINMYKVVFCYPFVVGIEITFFKKVNIRTFNFILTRFFFYNLHL